MATVSTSELTETLRPFLTPTQHDEVKRLLSSGLDSAPALAQELVRRGWLTLYQARLLVNGRGADLLLGPYIVMDRLGTGGAGQVYKAWHQPMQQVVAIKLLRPEAARDSEVVQRFYREIEIISQISHPNIVFAHEAGPVGKVLVLALEYVEGLTLEQQVERSGPLPVHRACDCIRQAALGLQYAHECGLVHRDIKPSNLVLTGDDQVKILDLGLARLSEATGSQTADLTVAGGRSVTQGTPDYMAPEQALDFHQADIRADIYSLGCAFYFLLTGQPPFSGGTLAQKLMKHQTVLPPLKHLQPAVPSGVARILTTMLAKAPNDRYQTPGEVALLLQPFCAADGTAVQTQSAPDTLQLTLDERTVQETLPNIPAPGAFRLKRWFRHRRRIGLALAGAALAASTALVAMFCTESSDRSATAPATPVAVATLAPPSEPAPVRLGGYRARFQGPTPSPGWQYLWNAKGPFGNPAHYQPLLWVGAEYNADGKGPVPRPEPGGYVRLARAGGHPGRGARQTPARFDYFAIAAYTIQPADGAGHYRLVGTSLRGGNGLEVVVHLGGRSPLFSGKVARDANPPVSFDTNIGRLAPGDTVYVGVGPDQDDGSDSFSELDFALERESGPVVLPGRKSVVLKEGFENAVIGWLPHGQAQFSRSNEKPHEGTQAYQIVVAPGTPLAYQQINRVVEENPPPGALYHLTAWVRTKDVAGDSGAYGYLEFLGDNDKRIGLQHTRVSVKNGARGWEPLSAEALAPSGTRRVRIGLVLNAAGTAWFDDVEVTRESGIQR